MSSIRCKAAACLALVLVGLATAQDQTVPEPFALRYIRDDSRAASKMIQAETGGTISVTNGAGDLIRLEIKPDALFYDETITLTPLDGASGIDGAERMIAVAMEPSGVTFSSPGYLTITPKDALAGEIWWFESPSGSDGSHARPALSLKGQSGMMVWHFSTGAVATGGPAIGEAVSARAVGEIPLSGKTSNEWLEWRRNKAEQDYQSGRIDKIKRDTDIEMIRDLQERLAVEAIEAEIAQRFKEQAKEAKDAIEEAEEIAKSGQISDADRLAHLMNIALESARQAELLGIEGGGRLSERTNQIFEAFLMGVRDNCEKTRDMGQETAMFVLANERQRQLLGLSDDEGVGKKLTDCLSREWSAGPYPLQTTYGPATITVRKSGCSEGVWGSYTYTSEGAVAGSFEFDAKPPRNNFVTFANIELTATLTPDYLSESYACKQSGQASVAEPPGAFFHVTARGFGVCSGSDDIGSVSLLYTNAIPLRAGPLCKRPEQR